jgi:hypothetical protein
MQPELDAAKTLYMLAALTFASPSGVQDQCSASSHQKAKRHNRPQQTSPKTCSKKVLFLKSKDIKR